MKRLLHCAALGLALLAFGTAALAVPQGEGMNTAGVIDYPTALDQITTHTIAGTLAIFDLGEPDLRPVSLRYGFQAGNFNLRLDSYWTTDPRDFDHAEARAKLRVLNLDEYRTYAAIGFMGRYVDLESKRKPVIDDKTYSLFGVVTTELFPFAKMDAFLVNLYLDNRFASFGLKVPLFQFVRAVTEADFHHASENKERWSGKLGVELEGEQNFFVQIYYFDQQVPDPPPGEKKRDIGHIRMQLGTGF